MEDRSFIYRTDALILVGGLMVLMIGCIYVGRKVGQKRIHVRPAGSGNTISAMFGLMAFLLAFTFGMSGSRYDTRRENIIDEANAIGTAILRADLYPEEERTEFRQDLKQYLEERIKYFQRGPGSDASTAKVDYGMKLWDRAAKLSHDPANFVASQQMIPALNEMFNTSSARLIGELSRVPDSIVGMLFVLSLASAFFLGYSSAAKGRLDWFVAVGFCVLTSVVVYITLDLDRPRRGFIQLSTPHKAMLDLRKLF